MNQSQFKEKPRMLHFNWNHQKAHKVSLLRTLFNRICYHCGTEDVTQTEEAHLRRMWTPIGYSKNFIRRHIGGQLQAKTNELQLQATTQRRSGTRYSISGVSQRPQAECWPCTVSGSHTSQQNHCATQPVQPKYTLKYEKKFWRSYRGQTP